MFIVVKGRLGVSMRVGDAEEAEEVEVATLTKGAVLGEMSLLLQKPRSATVVVKSRTCILAEIRYACIKSPSKVPYDTQKRPTNTRALSDGTLETLFEGRPDLQTRLAKIARKRTDSNHDTFARTESEQSTWFKEAMSKGDAISPERTESHKDAKGLKKKPTRASIGPIQEINLKHKDLEGGEGEKDGEQTGDTAAKAAASDEPWLEKYVDTLLFLLRRVWEKVMSRVRRDRLPQNVVPILITPVKRLEREVSQTPE